MFHKVSGKYLRLVNKLRLLAGYEALVGIELRKYFIKLTMYSLILASLTFFVTYFILKITSLKIVLTTPLLMSLIPYAASLLTYYFRVMSRRKSVETELKYYVISEGISVSRYTELINDLDDLVKYKSIFKNLSREASRLKKLKKLLPTFDAVKTYVKFIKSNFIRNLLLDYLFSLSLGTAFIWMQEKSKEFLYDIKVLNKAVLRLRATISIVVAIVLGYLPILSVMVTIVTNNQEFMFNTLLTSLLILPLSFLLIPKPPLHQHIDLNRKGTIAVLAILTYSITFVVYIIFKDLKLSLLTFSIIAILLGIRGLMNYISALMELHDVPRILSTMCEAPLTLVNPLKLLNNALSRSRSKTLRNIRVSLGHDVHEVMIKGVKLWITKFLLYTITKAIMKGSLDRERLLKLREVITEFISDFKYSLVVNIFILVLALSLPFMFSTVLMIVNTYVKIMDILIYYALAITLTYSIYASYVMFNDPLNTLIPGLTSLLFVILNAGCLR